MDSGAAAQSGLWSKFPSPCLYACVYVAWGWCAETLMHLGCLLSSADCRYLMCRGNSKEPEHQVQARDPLHCGGQCPASQSSSVAQSCLTNPIDCSMPGFPVHHQLLELAQTHAHQVSNAIHPSHPSSLKKKTQ